MAALGTRFANHRNRAGHHPYKATPAALVLGGPHLSVGNSAHRPWGAVHWVIEKLPKRTWSVIGCLGPEERSLAVWEYMRSSGRTGTSVLLRIMPESPRYAAAFADRVGLRLTKLNGIGSPSEGLPEVPLFAADAQIVNTVDQFAAVCEPHVLLDLSSLPKRFFFPFIKRLLLSRRIETLIATYTVPEHYLPGELAEDHSGFAHLPLFGPAGFPDKKVDMAIVSVGFMKLGLSDLLEPYKTGVAIRTLLPFPPGLPAYHRNWEFIREMRSTLPPGLPPPLRVEAYDCADTFDHIMQLTNQGTKNCIFAPFGPKPTSLAICLFASLAKNIVYYTQPRVYNPDYSTGIKTWNGRLAAYAYCLRVNGLDTYSLS